MAQCSMCFARSKYNVLLQGWTSLVAKTILGGEELTIVGRFPDLHRFFIMDGTMAVEVNMLISKT